jgi:hypothetical protein
MRAFAERSAWESPQMRDVKGFSAGHTCPEGMRRAGHRWGADELAGVAGQNGRTGGKPGVLN